MGLDQQLEEIAEDVQDWVDYKLRILDIELDKKIEEVGKRYLFYLVTDFIKLVGVARANPILSKINNGNKV